MVINKIKIPNTNVAIDVNDARIPALTNNGGKVLAVNSDATGLEWVEQSGNDSDRSVDIGLSVKWASMNIGATKPSDYGDYYAWGELTTKDNYSSETYTYSDNPDVLPASHDVATQTLGNDWRMPTSTELSELISTQGNSDYEWTWKSIDGHDGWEIKYLTNGNSIFLPAAGYRRGIGLDYAGYFGYYWSSSLNTDYPYNA